MIQNCKRHTAYQPDCDVCVIARMINEQNRRLRRAQRAVRGGAK